MLVLTQDAVLRCEHVRGTLEIVALQDFVTIQGRSILVEDYPQRRKIKGCPNLTPTTKPCTSALEREPIAGYSSFVTVQGKRVCLDTLKGLTDGMPPLTVKYLVREPGQNFVGVAQ